MLLEWIFSREIYGIILFPPSQVRATQRTLTLEELSEQPVNQQRPTILVNTAAEYVFFGGKFVGQSESKCCFVFDCSTFNPVLTSPLKYDS